MLIQAYRHNHNPRLFLQCHNFVQHNIVFTFKKYNGGNYYADLDDITDLKLQFKDFLLSIVNQFLFNCICFIWHMAYM